MRSFGDEGATEKIEMLEERLENIAEELEVTHRGRGMGGVQGGGRGDLRISPINWR